MKTRLAKLQEISCGDWSVLLYATVLLPLVSISLSTLGYKRTKSLMKLHTEADTNARPSEKDYENASSLARLVRVAARFSLLDSSCLRRSLVTRFLLQRRGIPCKLIIGIHKDQARLIAHAWVTVNGVPLAEDFDSISHFKVIESLPS